MKIGFCFNILHTEDSTNRELDFDSPQTIEGITRALQDLGHEVIKIEADKNIFEKLKVEKNNIDAVFNIAEGLYGDARETWVPMACEILRIPYTHSPPTVLALCQDKKLCKLAVKGLGIKVPEDNMFPAIVKPVGEGSSMGIFEENVVVNQAQMELRIKALRKMGIQGELLIEEYIEGREFTVGLMGNGEELEVLPIVEQKFPEGLKIAGYEMKWQVETKIQSVFEVVECPAKLTQMEKKKIEQICKKIYLGLKIHDCARIDLRMNKNGDICFIEINPLPGLIPDDNILSYFPLAARVAGYKYPQVLDRIMERIKNKV